MIRIGIIGCGNMGQEHAKALSAQPDVQIVALCNRTRSKAEMLAPRYPGAKVFDDCQELLAAKCVDALGVFVNVNQIMPVTLDCLDAKVPLLVEKPIGLDPEETQKIVDKSHAVKGHIMVALNRRFIGSIAKAKEIVDRAGGPTAIFIKGHERYSYVKSLNRYSDRELERWMYLNSIHLIDLLRYFGGNVTESVSYSQHHKRQYHAAMKFESGAAGYYESTFDCPDGWSVELFHPQMKLTLKPLEKLTVDRSDKTVETYELEPIDKDFKPGFFLQAKAFVDAIRTRSAPVPPSATLHDAHQSVLLAQKIVNERR